MKFRSLNLIAYGPFTDRRLEFAPSGVQLIHGPNEAGKSTALRAVRGLLFGIPPQTGDAHVHTYSDLRIRAELEAADGRTLAIIRRKGNRNTLLDATGDPLPDDTLRPWLQGLSEAMFSTAFGIGHEDLVRGGQALAEGEGDVGESLYAASAGLTHLHRVLKALEDEADALYSPRGSKPPINTALRAYREAVKTIREAALSGDEWAGAANELERLEASQAELRNRIAALSSERHRAERIVKAVGRIAQHKQYQKERDELGDVAVLPDGFYERRVEAELARDAAKRRLAEIAEALNDVATALKGIHVDEAVLRRVDDIEKLYRGLDVHRKAARDREQLEAEKQRFEQKAADKLADLPSDLVTVGQEPVPVDAATRNRLNSLARAHSALQSELDERTAHCSAQQALLEALKVKLDGVAERPDPVLLAEAVARLQREGDVEADLEAGQAERAKTEADATTALPRLGLWTGTLDALAGLAVPGQETVDRFESEWADAARDCRETRDRADALDAERRDLEARAAELARGGAIPSEAELASVRERRDEGWRLIRADWLEHQTDPDAVAAYAGQQPLDHAYEQQVRRADDIADQLRLDADRVTRHAELVARANALSAELQTAEAQHKAAVEAEAATHAAWHALWKPAGIAPLPPREMRPWLQRRDQLVQLADKIRTISQQLQQIENQMARGNAELRKILEGLGVTVPPGLGRGALIAFAQAELEAIRNQRQQHADLTARLQDAKENVRGAERNRAGTAARIEQWHAKWREAVADAGLAGELDPEAMSAVLEAIQGYHAAMDKAGDLAQRIDAILSDAEAYKAMVADVVETAAPGLADKPAHETVRLLNERLTTSRAAADERKRFNAQRDKLKEERTAAQAELEKAKDELQRLCNEAGCTDPSELPEAESLSREADRLDERMRQLRDEITELAAGTPFDAFVAEAEGEDTDALNGRIETIDGELAELDLRRTELDQTIGSKRRDFEQMDGRAAALEAGEEAQGHLGELANGVDRYVRLRAAARVLRNEIEQYRRENQGPVLDRAGALFAELTGGSFAGLDTEFDEKDNPILVARRPGGTALTMDGLSDGSRDQLYLALRVASLERFIERSEPMPFIIDDVLVNFDDNRAAAALRVLGRLGAQTQVLFFTHHAHLIGLAREALPAGHCAVIEL